ncbi:MAG: hypothetical protein ACYC35_20890 [Pirellulales bacterium]
MAPTRILVKLGLIAILTAVPAIAQEPVPLDKPLSGGMSAMPPLTPGFDGPPPLDALPEQSHTAMPGKSDAGTTGEPKSEAGSAGESKPDAAASGAVKSETAEGEVLPVGPETSSPADADLFMSETEMPSAGGYDPNSFQSNSFGPEEGCPVGEDCEPCWICGGGRYGRPGAWFIQAEGTAFQRTRPREATFTFTKQIINTTQGNFVVNGILQTTDALLFDAEAGLRATVGRYLGRDDMNRDHLWEFTYTGLNRWDASSSIRGNSFKDTENGITYGNLFTPFQVTSTLSPGTQDLGGFNRADLHQLDYASDFNSYEFNYRVRRRLTRDRLVLTPDGHWRRQCTPGATPSFFFGVRELSIHESFAFTSRGVITPEVGPSSQVSGDYLVTTRNNLVGFQVGGDYIQQNCRWSWGVRGKAGPYINFDSQSSHIVNSAPADLLSTMEIDRYLYGKGPNPAFVGEVGLLADYQIRPNMTLRAEYDFMWVAGLVLAPEQVDFTLSSTGKPVDSGYIMYQGATVGVEMTW